MRKIRKSTSYSHRVFAAVLAAVLLFTMPGMASHAEAETAQTEDISESVTVLAEYDAAEETETEVKQEPETGDSDTDKPGTGEDDAGDADAQKPAEKETVPAQKEDAEACICGTLCTRDSINEDCPVCGAEDADLSRCKGEKTENRSEENREDAEQGDTGAQDTGTNLCAHHKEHTKDCGYIPASEDGEGSPCTYECRICPIEDLIDALPDEVTEDNAEKVRAQLDEILALYRELSEDEQGQLDLSLCRELQEQLDAANTPAPIDELTEGAVAQVEIAGSITGCNTIEEAWTAAQGKTATVTLLADVTARGTLTVGAGSAITLKCGDYTLTSAEKTAVQVNGTLKLESGTIQSTYSDMNAIGINVNGTLEITGGAVAASTRVVSASEAVHADSGGNIIVSGGSLSGIWGILVDGGTATIKNGEISAQSRAIEVNTGTVTIEGGTFTGVAHGLNVKSGGTAVLRGGTFTGGNGGYAIYSKTVLSDLLDQTQKPGTYYAYFENGKPVALEDGQTSLDGGTFTVGECNHEGGVQDQGNGTHGGNCPYCGTEFAEEPHTLGEGNKCEGCGATLVAQVEIGNATTYYGTIESAWTAAKGSTATITLLASVKIGNPLMLNGGNITVIGRGHRITSEDFVFGVGGGKLAIESGTFSGGTAAIVTVGSANVDTCLKNYGDNSVSEHYAYFDENDAPIDVNKLTDPTQSPPTVTVRECTHPEVIKDQGNGTHGGNCPYCGTEFAEEPHTLGEGNKCEGCKAELKVQVEIGNATTYYGTIDAAWEAAEGATSAEITLLDHVTTNYLWGPVSGQNITFNGGNFEYTSTQALLSVAGHLTVNSGTFIATGGGQVALHVGPGGTATLNGGTFTGTGGSYWVAISSQQTPVSEFLAEGCAYYRNGKPIEMTGQTYLEGTVTVQECHHEGVKATPNNNGTHSLKCPYCGYTEAAENCSYGTGYQHDENSHWKTCAVCKGTTIPEAHYLRVTADEPVNGVTKNYEKCDDCDYTRNPFTVTATVPSGLTYGSTMGIKPSFIISTEKTYDTVQLVLEDGEGNKKWLEGDTLPDDISAGTYKLYLTGGLSDNPMPVFLGRAYFAVSPAPLTTNMVTLSPESVTYNDAEQKPTITVKQGETTLAPGTDYDVAYSTSDFTNAGTVIITITGKGNYKGTVEKTYAIKKAVLTTEGTGTANGTYGAKLSELLVTGLTAVYQGTVTEVPGTWKLTGSTVPAVGTTGTYTATFTPDTGAGNYEPLTAQVKLEIEKAEASALPEGTLYVQNNREQSYQYDLTQLLPALENGKSYGTVSYELGTDAVNILENFYTDGAEITGTTLTLPIQETETEDKTKIGTISITISSSNYKSTTATINVISVDKMPVNITGVSVAEQEYNGNAVKCTGTPKAVDSSDNTVMIDSGEYQYTWQTADGTALDGAPKDAGSYLLTVSVDNGAYTGSSTISFVINKASVTITANSMTVSKGSAKPTLTYAISGLAKGEALTVEPTLTCNADMNTAGRYPITVSGAAVPDSNNYHTEITYIQGALTVTASSSSGGSGSSGGGNGGGDRGNNSGNGSGSENNGDSGQGGSGGNGSENTAPGVSAIPAVTDTNTNQGTDADTVKPGTGNAARPGTGTKPGSSAANEERPDAGIPFIKGEDGKIGWNVIRAEEEKAEEGSVINVDMNGTVVVPGDIFDSIKGRDITITFDMGNGIIWSVDGKSVTTDKADYIDFSVKTGGSAVPVEIVNNVTGERYSIQLSLAHDGEFGFIAVLSVGIGEENAGYLASLYYYNEDTGELELICADEVAQDGTVSFAFTHASDYVVVVDRIVEEESDAEETEQTKESDNAQTQDRTDGNGGAVMGSPKEGQSRSRNLTGFIMMGIIALAGIGAGIFTMKKKKEKENNG